MQNGSEKIGGGGEEREDERRKGGTREEVSSQRKSTEKRLNTLRLSHNFVQRIFSTRGVELRVLLKSVVRANKV